MTGLEINFFIYCLPELSSPSLINYPHDFYLWANIIFWCCGLVILVISIPAEIGINFFSSYRDLLSSGVIVLSVSGTEIDFPL